MKIAWARTALADLRDIIDYIEIRNRVAAKTTYHLISGSVSQLANHPFIGRAGRVTGTREMIVNGTPYLVAYRLAESRIDIIAVLHGSRKWPIEFSE
ncbi:MAG: type II toxin-antitoxin system RelE/ParE family toxin [Pseudomonadota bacterium]